MWLQTIFGNDHIDRPDVAPKRSTGFVSLKAGLIEQMNE